MKNKFILKLVRTLMNKSEEHLEVDIHCKHRRLFPNNSFVRDLVTILNDKNIKVSVSPNYNCICWTRAAMSCCYASPERIPTK